MGKVREVSLILIFHMSSLVKGQGLCDIGRSNPREIQKNIKNWEFFARREFRVFPFDS